MLQDSIILHTKLQPPRVSDIIHRDRFDSLVSQFKDKQLITVTAGAGYGKTTFVIDALNQINVKSVWYRMDKSDIDFITFYQYLSFGIKNNYPDFGDEIFSLLNDPEGVDRTHEYFLTLFINDLERFSDEDIFFVFDDFHLVKDSQEIKNALEFILNHLPNRIHLILIGRSSVILPLSRLKSMRAVLGIDEKDLCFNKQEIKKLFFEVFNIPINEDQVKELYKKTNGWISGLILFYHTLKGKAGDEIETFIKNLKGSKGEVFTYLEENIFNQLSLDDQSFLVKTSILLRLNPEFCDQLLGINNSKEILKRFKENHLFTLSLDGEKEGYIYHDLLKDFLGEKLRFQIDEKEVKALHAKIAKLYEKRGENRTALDHYVMAGQIEDVSRMIGLFAWKWIRQGKVQQIRFFLEDIPEPYLKNDPWFLYLQAGLMELSGHIKQAILGYNKALEAFRSRSLDDGLMICLYELAIAYNNLNDYEKAEPLFKELISSPSVHSMLKIGSLGNLISISCYLGRISESDKYTEKAMAILSEMSGNKNIAPMRDWIFISIAWKNLAQGKLYDALENTKKVSENLKHSRKYRLFALCNLIMSHAYYQLAHYNKGMDTARQALDIVKENGIKDTISQGGHLCIGYNYFGLGFLDEALKHAQKALEICRERSYFVNQAWANILLYQIYFYNFGDLKTAEKNILEAMNAIEDLNIPYVHNLLKIDLASIMIEKGEYEKAKELLKHAKNRTQHFMWYQALIHIKYSRFYQKNNQKDKAITSLYKGLSLCEKNGYDTIFVCQKKWVVPLLVEIFAKGEKQDYIRNALKKIGPEAVNELSIIIESNPYDLIKNAAIDLFNELRRDLAMGLKIHFFGKFRLFMGETELLVNKWKSKKALQLFKYLVHSRHRGYLSKEVLMELLWPDEDPTKSANRFHVLLASMRKDLEPNLAKGVPSAYIQSNGSAYMLDIGKDGWVDIEEFSNEIKHAKTSKDPEESISRYLNAISLYQGDFLEEDLYIDWCADVRERYKEDYLYALKEVIKFYEKRKAFDQCIEYASAYLKADKCAEEIYQVLMRCHSLQNNKAMLIKTFEKCKKTIQNELNCPLSQETLDLYQALNPN